MIRFACPSCGQSVRAPRTGAGKKGRCPFCQGVYVIPGAANGSAAAAPEELEDNVAELAAVVEGAFPTPAKPSPTPPPPPPLAGAPQLDDIQLESEADASDKTDLFPSPDAQEQQGPAQPQGSRTRPASRHAAAMPRPSRTRLLVIIVAAAVIVLIAVLAAVLLRPR